MAIKLGAPKLLFYLPAVGFEPTTNDLQTETSVNRIEEPTS
jgi:hypothetical protein